MTPAPLSLARERRSGGEGLPVKARSSPRPRDKGHHGSLVPRTQHALRRPLADGWPVAAALARLAFWDGWLEARWDRYDRDGATEDLPDGILDLANAAGPPSWLAIAPRAAALALSAAEVVDRSLHRGSHLDQIDQALAGWRQESHAPST